MKKTLCFIFIIILISLTFTSCSFGVSVEELLVAPSLSDNQVAVLQALEEEHPNRITFVYPLTGANRSAIQKYDLDGDGNEEIIAFYKDSTEGLNAFLSVLEKTDDTSYTVVSTLEGYGDSINSVFYLSSVVSEDVVLIEWKSRNKSSNTISVFTYADHQLEVGFEENSLDLMVLDTDQTQPTSFCYIIPASVENGFALKFVRSNEDSIYSRSQYNLSQDVEEIISLNTGYLKNGSSAIFIDEKNENGMQTDIFIRSIDNSRLSRAEVEGGIDLVKLSARPSDLNLCCTDLDGVYCFPSSVAPSKDILFPDSWIYWYSLDDNLVTLERTTYYSKEFGFLLTIPPSWLPICEVIQNEDGIQITDRTNEASLLTLVMLSIDDDVMPYVSSGYYLLGTNGTSRYYVNVSSTEEDDETLIQKSFMVFD